ncbi:hypothetical protein N7457_009863 [Penicillium paradoxum]|uniref:uncharacterized protein n=1 Tax=Penicillium paradoxum TaxID=176176 RepID=UPI002546B84B|nr:uncharacterized protein N7457_009863 [Penicillium paradoxum]KAJ5774967.1 hypothetical protein N7457_009863 [Penicillium paradoxum]
MVKADVRKDYYADLGLQPSAEPEEIKKQFRKLALKYHPDRNPGREVEFIAKFQAIQAANEILSDCSQRLKYDTDRLRAGYGKVYGPPKANTQRKTQTPTRAPQPTETYSANKYAHGSRNGPSAGAQRYASHARADPQQWKQPDTSQTRADAFRGFNNMRGGQSAGWQGFDPSTGRATGSTPGPGAQRHPFGASAQSTRPKSAFETRQSAQPNAQSFKKKHGFAPGVAGGDEPMARNTSAYSSSNRTERPTSQYFNPAPPPTAKKPASPEPPRPQRHSYTADFERTSRTYAQTGKGERTVFSSTGLGRSATMRTPSGTHTHAHKGTASPASGRSTRHRSASPKPRRDTNNYDSTSSSDSEGDMPKPKAVPKSRLRPNQKFADFHQQGTASPGNGKVFKSVPIGRKIQAVEQPDGSFKFRSIPRELLFMRCAYADKDTPKGHTSDSAAFPKSSYRSDQQPNPSGSTDSVKYVQDTLSRLNSLFLTDFGSSSDKAPGAQRPQSAAFERNKASDLHKKFSAEDWRDHINQFDFMGSASPSKDSNPRSPAGQNRGRTANRNGQTSSTGSPLPNPFGSTPLYQGSQQQQSPTPFAQAKFSADSWAQKLQNLSWTGADAEKAKQAANAASSRSPKKQPKAGVKVRSAPQQPSVATEADEIKETLNGDTLRPEPVAPDVEEMDLDEDLPTPPDLPPKVPVVGAASGSYPDLASQTVPGTQPVKKPKPPRPTERSASNADSRTPLFNFDNIRNTAPFTNTTSGGIENLEDFHTALPFESQAKQQKATKNDIRPRLLQLPNPPKRPRVPEPFFPSPTSNHPVLPREKWNWYVSAMGAYMHEWNVFNGRMLTHFNARHEANQTGLAPGWISAVGDSTRLKMNGVDDDDIDGKAKAHKDADDYIEESLIPGKNKGGFSAYLRGIEEDIQVRKHWDVACELHRDCIHELGTLRDWIRDGGKVV